MRIAIDTSALYTARAGVHRYVRGLLAGLKALGGDAPEITEIAWPVDNYGFGQPRRALRTAFRELAWAPFVAPRLLRRGDFDLLHSPASWFIAPPTKMPHTVTLHDVAVLRNPSRFRPWHRITGRHRLRQLRRAGRVIAVSEFTANEAMALLGLERSRMDVVHSGPGLCGVPGVATTESDPQIGRDQDFLLFVGSLEPGKNIRLLGDMYRLATAAGATLPPLVIAGTRWHGVTSEGPPPANWTFLPCPEDAHLIWLYARATALLFPSVYEGFGFPVLEAMSFGCPVICSRVASLPEVGGDAAAYADLTPAAYLEATRRLLSDQGGRCHLADRGRAWASRFSWERCARETLAVYNRAIDSR